MGQCPIARRIKGLDWCLLFHCTYGIHVIQTCHTLLDPEQYFIVASDMKIFKEVTNFKYLSV